MISIALPRTVLVDVDEESAYGWLLAHPPAALCAGLAGEAPAALVRHIWDQNPHLRQWAATEWLLSQATRGGGPAHENA